MFSVDDIGGLADDKSMLFSPSRLKTFEQCRMKYKYRYIDKLPVKPVYNIETVEGKIIHEILERHSIGANIDDLAAEVFEKNGMLYDKSEYGGIIQNVKAFKESVPTTAKSEEELVLPLSGQAGIMGIVDLMYLDGNKMHIYDCKTAKRRNDLLHVFQLQCYASMAVKLFGVEADARIFYVRLGDTGEPITMDDRQANCFLCDRVNDIKVILDCHRFPCRESFMCKYCDFQKICPAKQGDVS